MLPAAASLTHIPPIRPGPSHSDGASHTSVTLITILWRYNESFLTIWSLDIFAITHPLMTTTDVTNNDTHLWSRSQPFYSASDWSMPYYPGLSLVLTNHPRVSETILIHIARNSATPAPWWARWHGEIRGYSTFNFITFWLPRPDTFSLSRTKKALVCRNPLHWFEFHLLLLQLAILTSLSLLWLK